MDDDRNIRVVIGNRTFEVRIQNPNASREGFIQRIINVLSNIGPLVNAVGPAAPNGNIRVMIGDRSFDLIIQNPNASREGVIQRIRNVLANLDPAVNAAAPLGVNAGLGVNVVASDVNIDPPLGVNIGLSAECMAAFECPICKEQYSNNRRPTTLPCGHSLCMIDAGHVNSTCPICRGPFFLANQRMSVSLMEASLTCGRAPSEGGRRRHRRLTKRRRKRSKRRR